MQPAHGVTSENLLFHNLPRVVPNTCILAAQFEPDAMADNAADLAATSGDPSVQFTRVPRNTHVSMLFSPTVARESQAWAARLLSLPGKPSLPWRANFLGCLLGLLGLLLLAGPFLREMVGNEPSADLTPERRVPLLRGALELALFSVVAVHVLRFWQPLRILHLYQADYLASFFLIVGIGVILLHLTLARAHLYTSPKFLLGAVFGGILLHFLITGWFELTATGAWLTQQRWLRFPLFFLATLFFLYGVELLAGPVRNWGLRYSFWLLLIVLAWLPIVFGVFYLKTGEFLLVLLSPYFAVEFLVAGLGAQLVRRQSGSAAAAALFGAILLAGFCLALFPLS
jgi:hypothetical protein